MKINYLQFGKRGQPIVFLHGWQQNSRSFATLVPFFYKDYRLFLFDLPGFGKSEFPPPGFSSFDYAKAVSGWLKEKGLKKVILVGHSFGGKIAAIIAYQEPTLILKLVLIASAGLPHSKKYYQLKKFIPPRLIKKIPSCLRSVFVSRDYKQAGELLPIFKTIVKEDIRPIFSKISNPTLIIWGKNDQELPTEDGKKIHQLIKKSKLAIISGDHFPFWENPQKVAKLINQFIKNEGD